MQRVAHRRSDEVHQVERLRRERGFFSAEEFTAVGGLVMHLVDCPCCKGVGWLAVCEDVQSPDPQWFQCTHCMGKGQVPAEVDDEVSGG